MEAKEKIDLLEQKMQTITETFGIVNSELEKTEIAVNELSAEVKELPEGDSMKIIATTLDEDFLDVRATLKNLIKQGENVVSVLGDYINSGGMLMEGTDPSALMSGYASIVKSTNDSIKILADIHKSAVDIHLKINKQNASVSENKEPTQRGGGLSSADILKMLNDG